MVTGSLLLWIFVASLLLVFGLIVWAKLDAFLSLIAGSIVTGLVVGIGMDKLPGIITAGFGGTLGGIGITIGLGVMLGELLFAAGATQRIADTLIRAFGEKRSPLAIALTGWVVSIPVFFDAAFVLLIGLIRQISKRTRISMVTLVTALAVGLIATHAMVAPTPGPLVVAANMKINLGYFILYSAIVSLVAVLIGGWAYGVWAGRNAAPYDGEDAPAPETAHESAAAKEAAAAQESRQLPSAFLSYGILILPILLIVLNTVFAVAAKGSPTAKFFGFVGDKNVALFISVIVASLALKPYFQEKSGDVLSRAIKSTGLILLITGAGGAFGNVIQSSGIGNFLVDTMKGWSMPVILLAFLFSQILRIAQGSTTVALVTTSSVLGPMVGSLGVSPMLVALAITAGGIGMSMPNDSGFWVISKFGNFDMKDTFRTWTIAGTVTGLVALLTIFVLSLFSGILPGI